MFKFGFSQTPCDEEEDLTTDLKRDWQKCEEIKDLGSLAKHLIENVQINTISIEYLNIKYLKVNEIVQILKEQNVEENCVLKAEQNHSDLLPAVYEGGGKIWECTYDLLKFLVNNINFKNKNVLDLGCGSGILGILSLLQGAKCCFQDYNKEVIKYITVPNVLINNGSSLNACKFYSGDWEFFSNLLQQTTVEYTDKFDYILTSETIYNTENYTKLHQVFEAFLKHDGVIFLAAKNFYFGVGGGIALFQEYLKKLRIFKYEICWEHSEGIKRTILKITFDK